MSRLKPKHDLLIDNSNSPFSQSFRQLRTNVEFSLLDEEVRTVMITSSKEGEGKSTTAANLAIAYAMSGKKTLLIDADLINPSQHHIFELKNGGEGLTSVLSSRKAIKDVLLNTYVDNLFLMLTGPVYTNTTEWLGSKLMAQLIEGLKEQFEMIVIDTPSLQKSSDAQAMAAYSDGVLLVVNAGKVKKDEVAKAKQTLSLVKARVLGAVLNNVK